MTAPVTIPARAAAPSRSVPQQHADQSFPHVLVAGTAGAILTLGSVLVTVLAFA
ncbi:MAG: hypothetical protein AB7S70_15135 [Hyphomicrobium sp.]|uniref:hypothetical protein n=1 Tax=Hyphomicrobium sp. TaxID=82 RepID=UPI003D110966